MNTDSNVALYTDDIKVEPEEVVIDCAVVRSAGKFFDVLIESYKNIYPNVKITYFEQGNSSCISACASDECDLALITKELGDEEKQMANFELKTLCRSGVAVIVNANNPVTNLSAEQVRDIFCENITNWSMVEGENEIIYLYSVDDRFMGYLLRAFSIEDIDIIYNETPDVFMYKPQVLLTEYPQGITGMQVGKLEVNPEVKAVNIDGVAPTYNNVKSGEYPYYIDAMFITKSDVSEEVKKFIEFCTTDPEVIEYLKSEGYVIP